METSIQRLLVANRGEIARRIFKTCKSLGIETIAVYSEADRELPYVREADQSLRLIGFEAKDTYLNGDKIIAAAKSVGADAIHPGYGFLSENAHFAERVLSEGLIWVGPPHSAMRALGDKASARKAAAAVGVPTVKGYDGPNSNAELIQAAQEIGFPLLIKASAGGGGRGMRRVDRLEDMEEAIDSARRESIGSFASDHLLLEKLILRPRHIEVQVFGDTHGNVVHLYERECSIQRRHQKIIEEAPSPAVDAALRERLGEAAVLFAKHAGYTGAGTVEFLLNEQHEFFLLEMNARLQVEHPVTEAITGLDLVAWQIAVAEGKPLPLSQEELPAPKGHAIEVRLCAEDPLRDFLPATGKLFRLDVETGTGLRLDIGFEEENELSPYYDSMIGKLIAFGETREIATRRLSRALKKAWIPGVSTNLPLLREILAHTLWKSGSLHTGFLSEAGLPTPPPLNSAEGIRGALCYDVFQRIAKDSLGAGFSIDGPRIEKDKWVSGNDEFLVSYQILSHDRIRVNINQTTWEAKLVRFSETILCIEDDLGMHTWRVHHNLELDTFYLHLGHGEAFVRRLPRFSPPLQAVEPGTCRATTPGKVVAIHVEVGQTVSKGEFLLVLEAMKMEHRVISPADGRVERIDVVVGDTVSDGQLLIKIAEET